MLEKKEEKKERKEWVELELIKCDEPLDQVTMGNAGMTLNEYTAITRLSDRNAKENLAPVNGR